MSESKVTLSDALAALERERVENVRLRRKLLDLLYNLDEENMPAIVARIETSEKALAAENERLSLLFTTDADGATALSGEALAQALSEEGAALLLSSLTLSEGTSLLSALPGALSIGYTESHPPRTYVLRTTLSPATLELLQDDAGSGTVGGDTLTLSPRGLCIPYLRRKAAAKASGLYPLYIDKDGNILAAYT